MQPMMAPPVMPHDVASVEPRVGPLHTIATTVPKTAAESTFALAASTKMVLRARLIRLASPALSPARSGQARCFLGGRCIARPRGARLVRSCVVCQARCERRQNNDFRAGVTRVVTTALRTAREYHSSSRVRDACALVRHPNQSPAR